MELKRWCHNESAYNGVVPMKEDDEGDWVRYDDIKHLLEPQPDEACVSCPYRETDICMKCSHNHATRPDIERLVNEFEKAAIAREDSYGTHPDYQQGYKEDYEEARTALLKALARPSSNDSEWLRKLVARYREAVREDSKYCTDRTLQEMFTAEKALLEAMGVE